MRKKLSSITAVSIVAIMLLSALPLFTQVGALPADSMWITPVNNTYSTGTTSLGFKFNITVWLNITSDNVFGYQIAMYYDNTTLKCTRSDFTGAPGGPSQFMTGHSTSVSGPIIDTSFLGGGSILAFESCKGSDFINTTINPSGSLIWAEFEIIAVPGKNETLTSIFDIQTETTAGRNWVKNRSLAIISITAYNANYKYAWTPPSTNPCMAVEHGGYFGTPPWPPVPPAGTWPLNYGPYPPGVVGSGFVASIYIDTLDAAWGLTNCSFTLKWNSTVIDVLGGVANVSIGPGWIGPNTKIIPSAGQLDIFVQNYVTPPSGKVLVATVTFTIMMQGSVPPKPMNYYDSSTLTFSNVIMWDHTMQLTTSASKNGVVRVYALLTLPIAWFEVNPPLVVLGPEYAIGQEFDVKVQVVNLHFAWYVVGIQFRLTFDPTLLDLVSVTEGPFMKNSTWNIHPPTGFVATEEVPTPLIPYHNVAVFNWIRPNGTGVYDQTIFPHTVGHTPETHGLDPTVAIIRFKAIAQESGCIDVENLTCGLDILPFWFPEDKHLINKEAKYVSTDKSKMVNGTYIMQPNFQVGRLIDIYGGAVNRGYGVEYVVPPDPTEQAFPAPYGGQGPNGNMDLVIPQSVVFLFANVTYNCWPVQSKDVGFEIEGPFYQEGWTPEQPVPREAYHMRKYSSRTSTGECDDPGGVAWIKFQMPWPCDNPEDYFGKYRVTATVDICGVVVNDTLWFDYYYLVEITKVTTDKTYYQHCEDMHVTIEFRSKAQQNYPVLFSVVIQDELETAFDAFLVETRVGGAEFCHWKDYVTNVTLHVVKWAFAGIAKIYVSAFDKDPTIGGAPWLPTYGLGWPPEATLPEIIILPQ